MKVFEDGSYPDTPAPRALLHDPVSKPFSTRLLDPFLFCYISVFKWGLQLDLANTPKS